jgi:hypothetical protein
MTLGINLTPNGLPIFSLYATVRAKLVLRMFAIIKNNKVYEKNYPVALA